MILSDRKRHINRECYISLASMFLLSLNIQGYGTFAVNIVEY